MYGEFLHDAYAALDLNPSFLSLDDCIAESVRVLGSRCRCHGSGVVHDERAAGVHAIESLVGSEVYGAWWSEYAYQEAEVVDVDVP